MKESKAVHREKALIRILLYDYILPTIRKRGVQTIDSNVIHFMLHRIVDAHPPKENLSCKKLSCGWFYHGIYFPLLDDILVEDGLMDKKYHQLKGEEPFCHEWSKTIYRNWWYAFRSKIRQLLYKIGV